MSRLARILSHVSQADVDANSPHTEAQQELFKKVSLRAVQSALIISQPKLQELMHLMVSEMDKGLRFATGGETTSDSKPVGEHQRSTLRMLPAYVYRADPSKVKGNVFALDLGGTNFRVLRMEVSGGQIISTAQKKFEIPMTHVRGNAEGLFGFIAESVHDFLASEARRGDSNCMRLLLHDDINSSLKDGNKRGFVQSAPLGFTFSFPMSQTGINVGSLIKWTKGFTTEGVVGQDLCKLLKSALDKNGIALEPVALCNDTVGTLVARYFRDTSTEVGVILGTGANASYWEKSANITKSPAIVADAKANPEKREMAINIEFGNFDSFEMLALPITSYDEIINESSVNPGEQRFEKLISGMYLGEIFRQIALALAANGTLPISFIERIGGDANRYKFLAMHAAMLSSDISPGLINSKEILENVYGIEKTTVADREIVKNVAALVFSRSAQLAGMAISAILMKTGRHADATVAIDGSVFEKTPYYPAKLVQTVKELLGADCDIRVVLQKDGSGVGAGSIAALAAPKK